MALHSPSTFKLPNGLQVAAVERPYGRAFAMVLAYGAGSFDDPRALPGLAHFCEHLAFRGANRQLAEKLTALGAYVNGNTSFDHTLFEVHGHIDHLPLAIEFIANILRNETRVEDDIAVERNIIWHEFSADSHESEREVDLDQHARAALGDPNWNISRKRWLSALKRTSADAVNSFRRVYYHPTNARLAFVGPISCDAVQRIFQESVSWNSDEIVPNEIKPVRQLNIPKRVAMTVDAYPYVWIYVTHLVANTSPIMRFAAEVLASLLGGGPHSALFRELRTDRHLAYSVHADDLPYRHCTGLYCYTTVSRWSVIKTLDLILACEEKFYAHGIGAEELESARLRISQRFEMQIDYPEHLASYLAYELLRPPDDALIRTDEYLHFLEKLTVEEVNEAAKELLSPSNRLVYVGGKVGVLARYRIRRKLREALH